MVESQPQEDLRLNGSGYSNRAWLSILGLSCQCHVVPFVSDSPRPHEGALEWYVPANPILSLGASDEVVTACTSVGEHSTERPLGVATAFYVSISLFDMKMSPAHVGSLTK